MTRPAVLRRWSPLIIVFALPVAPVVVLAGQRAAVSAGWALAAILAGSALTWSILFLVRWERRIAPPTDAVVPGGLARVSGARRHQYVVPSELPPPPGTLFGRDAEIQRICDHLVSGAGPAVAYVSGEDGVAAGVGSSALALDAAHQVADQFRDGQLLVRFGPGAVSSVADGLEMLVKALKRPEEPMPPPADRAGWYARRSGRGRLLVILDDVPDAELVRPLLPTGPSTAAIVTSRAPLAGQPADLAVRLKPLSLSHALAAFAALVGEERVTTERSAAERIVAATGGYPVAIHIAGTALAKRRNWTLAATVLRMTEDPLPAGGHALPPYTGILNLVFGLLTERERIALTLLGLIDRADLAPWMLATLFRESENAEVPEAAAGRLLDRLAQMRLVERQFDDRSGTLRYRISEPVRDYALARYRHRLARGPAEALARQDRVAQALAAGQARRDQASPERLLRTTVYRHLHAGQLSQALDTAREATAVAQERSRSVGAGTEEGLTLAALAEVNAEHGWIDSGLTDATLALQPDKASERSRPRALRVLGTLHRRLRQIGAAEENLTEAFAAADAIRELPEQVRVLRELAAAQALSDRPERGEQVVVQARKLCARTGESGARLLPSVLWAHGLMLSECHRLREADRVLSEAEPLAKHPVLGSPLWGAWIRHQRTVVARLAGDYAYAVELGRYALEGFTGMRHRYGAAHCRLELGRAYLADGDLGSAIPMLEEAHSTLLRCGDRWIEAIAALDLAQAYHQDGQQSAAATLLGAAEQAFSKLDDRHNEDLASKLLWQVETSPPPVVRESVPPVEPADRRRPKWHLKRDRVRA